jgi:hypothetical protein
VRITPALSGVASPLAAARNCPKPNAGDACNYATRK